MSDTKIRIVAKDDSAAAFKTAIANINNLKAGMSGLTAGLASGIIGGLSVAGLTNFAKSAIDGMDALNDLKDATGASIENISALEDVAARTGTKFDTVGAALVKFNGILNSADPDSGAAAALKAIGLEADRLKGIDPAEALRQTAVALSKFADDGNKARIIQELFGKSVKEVAPFLGNLATQTALVGSLTAKQVEEAGKFNDQLAIMQKNLTDATRVLAGEFATVINKTIENFQRGTKEGKSFWQVAFPSNAEIIARFDAANEVQDRYTSRIKEIGVKLQESNIHESQRNALMRERATLQARLGALPDFSADNESSAETARLTRRLNVKPPLPKDPKGVKVDPEAQAKSYLESLQRQLDKANELSIAEQALSEIRSGRIGPSGDSLQAEILATAKELDAKEANTKAEKRLAEAIKKTSEAQEEFFAAVMKSDDAKRDQLATMLADTPTGNLEKQRSDVQLLTAEFENGRISEGLYLEAVTSRLNLAADKMATTKTLAEDLNLSFSSAFEDAIVGGKGLSEVLSGLEADILRIITRKLVTEPLGNAISGALGGSGGFNPGNFIAGLFSADGGGYTGGGPRSGGVDGKGGFMALLHPQETVVDHTRGQSITKSNSVTVNIAQSFSPSTSRATTMQAASDARRQLEYAGRNL